MDIIPGYKWLRSGVGKRSLEHESIIGNVTVFTGENCTDGASLTHGTVHGWTEYFAKSLGGEDGELKCRRWGLESFWGALREAGTTEHPIFCDSFTILLLYANIERYLKNIHLK